MSILNHPDISQAYFFPQSDVYSEATKVVLESATLRCAHYCPHPDLPTLIHFHGNGESVAAYERSSFASFLSRELCGVNVLMMEYRGYGKSSGKPELVSMLSDGEGVLRKLNLSPAQTIAYGRSIGSLYAIELANRWPDLAGLVIDSGIADIRERFLDNPRLQQASAGLDFAEIESEIVKHFDHQAKLTRYANPLLVLHTENDGLIQPHHAERIYQWSGSKCKQLRMYYTGNHNTIFRENYRDMLYALRELCLDIFPDAPWLPFQGQCTAPASAAYVRVERSNSQ